MSRHYADSKLFNWIRKKLKTDKPYALPWGGWEIWENDYKKRRPVAHFITETLPDWLEKPAEWVIDPIDKATYYLRNRYVNKTHMLRTDLEKGKWHEFETRLLHGAFTELVDFVEIEKAWMSVVWNDESRKKYKLPWWRKTNWFRWKEWRCPAAGIDHLKWEIELDGGPAKNDQAKSAFETMFLYTWWKHVRANREDPWIETGFREFWDSMEVKHGDDWLGMGKRRKMSKAEEAEYDRLNKAVHQLEEDRHYEDEEMLIRLVKLRCNLWT